MTCVPTKQLVILLYVWRTGCAKSSFKVVQETILGIQYFLFYPSFGMKLYHLDAGPP